jgi:hypothetical protein
MSRVMRGNTQLMNMLQPSFGQYFLNNDTGNINWWNGVEWEHVEGTLLPIADRFRRAAVEGGGGSSPGPRRVAGANGTGAGSDPSLTNPSLYPAPPAPNPTVLGGMDVPILAAGSGDSNSQSVAFHNGAGTGIPVVPGAKLYRPSSAASFGVEVPVVWAGSGDNPPPGFPGFPTVGPLHPTGANPNITGWTITGGGTVSFTAFFETAGVFPLGGTNITIRTYRSGVLVQTDVFFAPPGFQTPQMSVFVVALPVVPLSAITFTFFVNGNNNVGHSAGNPDTVMTGGSLFP